MTNEEKSKLFDILASMQGGILEIRNDIKSLQNDVLKLNIWRETEYEEKHQALLEGQSAILEQLTPRSRIDDMENEIRFLKSIVQRVVDDMQKLQQAQ